jgi:hypothetical protein
MRPLRPWLWLLLVDALLLEQSIQAWEGEDISIEGLIIYFIDVEVIKIGILRIDGGEDIGDNVTHERIVQSAITLLHVRTIKLIESIHCMLADLPNILWILSLLRHVVVDGVRFRL